MEADGRGIGVYPFTRTEAETDELRRCCGLWREAPERFWEFDDVLRALGRPSSLGLYAADGAGLPWRGVLLADVGPFTADLLYLFVKREDRRRGVARALLTQVLVALEQRPQIEALLLEVRESNTGAQALYRDLGLALVGRRKAYYANGEDAQVLRYDFVREAPR